MYKIKNRCGGENMKIFVKMIVIVGSLVLVGCGGGGGTSGGSLPYSGKTKKQH